MVFIWDEPNTRRNIGKKEKEFLHHQQNGKCMYCGVKLDVEHMHADHKTPIAKNGSNRLTNLQMLCGPCNTRKGAMTDGEFRRIYKAVGIKPSREAKGPPSRKIELSKFEAITKSKQTARAKRKRKEDSWW